MSGCLGIQLLILRSSSIKGRLPLKVVFHWRLSSMGDCLPLEAVFIASNFQFWFGPLSMKKIFEENLISSC